MLQSATSLIEQHTVRALTQGPQTARAIFVSLKKKQVDCSLQGLYRILRKLIAAGVITKQKKQYSIALSWFLDLQAMVKSMESTYLKSSNTEQLIPTKARALRWRFTDLQQLNTFWSHLLLNVCKETGSQHSLHYYPHAWHAVLFEPHSIQFSNALSQLVPRSYVVHGYRTYLNQLVSRIMADPYPQKHIYVASAQERIHQEEHTYVDVIEDYVISVKLDDETVALLQKLFVKTTAGQDIDALLLAEVLNHKPDARVLIQHSTKKARAIRRKFTELFGPLDRD